MLFRSDDGGAGGAEGSCGTEGRLRGADIGGSFLEETDGIVVIGGWGVICWW